MLIQAIVDEFNQYFDRDPKHDTVLWFDPGREWQKLLPRLAGELPLLAYVEDDQEALVHQIAAQGGQTVHKSQLKARYLLANRQPGEQWVVYLPMSKTQARFLRPYFYTAKCYEDTIEKALNRSGVSLPDDHKTAPKVRALLPALAAASVGKGRSFWEGIVSLQAALERLFANWEDTLLRFLANPRRALAELEREGVRQPFFELVRLSFETEPPTAGQEETWTEQFTARLCLVDLFEESQRPADFPFMDSLPPPHVRSRYSNFLRSWQHHDLFKAAFRRLAKLIDPRYQLGNWALTLPAPPRRSTFLNIEQVLWEQTQQTLAGLDSKAAVIAFVRQQRPFFQSRASGFWAREGDVSGWGVLSRMADTILGAQQAIETAAQLSTPAAIIERYTKTWWQIDADYRHFLTELDHSTSHLDAALKWTGRIYQDYLQQTNSRFASLVAGQGRWPPAGEQVGAAPRWETAVRSGQGLQAIILVDALRYELAQELARRLELAANQLSSGLSPLPSVTEIGMAALLPGWPDFTVDYEAGGWVITAAGHNDNLAKKEKRIAWLAEHLGGAAVYDLDQWLATSLANFETAQSWLVITTSTIDAIGEGVGQVAIHTFETLLGRLEQGVRRLQAAGCRDIHIVTDHGFLLRENIRETDKVQAKADGILKKQARYLVTRSRLPAVDLPHLPVSGSRDLIAWFPHDVGCFVTRGPYNYMHGGISLQETVTAHLHLRQTVTEPLVGVGLELAGGTEIRNAFFKVRLLPQNVDLFSRGRPVEIDVMRGQERVSRVWEEKIERDPVEKTLMLESDYGLTMGDQVRVRVRDKNTKELLAEQAATVLVDLEF